jgi:hypothetical protein
VITIATAVSVGWYSLAKMLSNAMELRTVTESYLATCRDAGLKRKLMTTYKAPSEEMSEEIPAAQAIDRSESSTQRELGDNDPER